LRDGSIPRVGIPRGSGFFLNPDPASPYWFITSRDSSES